MCIRCLVALHHADAAMLLQQHSTERDCTWPVCTAYVLLHLHALHEAHKANIKFFAHLPPDAGCLLQGYSCLQKNISTTRRMLPFLALPMYIQTQIQASFVLISISRNARSTLPVITRVLVFSPLKSALSFRSHTPVQTDTCRPGYPLQSTQQGCN